jgi:hypothetical protein
MEITHNLLIQRWRGITILPQERGNLHLPSSLKAKHERGYFGIAQMEFFGKGAFEPHPGGQKLTRTPRSSSGVIPASLSSVSQHHCEL